MARPQIPDQLAKIKELRQRGEGLPPDDDALVFQTWRRDVRAFMTRSFGEAHPYVADFDKVRFSSVYFSQDSSRNVKSFRNGMTSALAILDSLATELTEYGLPSDRTADPFELVRLICKRFHAVARQLRERHRERSALEIEDEYDVQYLMHGLLKIYFDDIRPEEWTPSYAGGSARMDFLLKPEELVVETKKARKGLAPKQVGEELIVDFAKYRAHPSCKALFCFVYDPEGRLANPSALMSDLSGTRDGIRVEVFIAPAQ